MPISKAGSSTDQAGFTLIELALVVFLLGLFAALAIPRLPSVDAGGPARGARKLAGTAKFLYNEAALSGREQRLICNLDQGRIRPRTLAENGELAPVKGLPQETQLPRGVSFVDVAIAGKEKITHGEATTPFFPAGWLPETVVHLKTDDGEILTVRLLSFTGTAEVYEGYREF